MSVIIDIDHEAGDLSEWSSTVTDSGDLSVSAAAALASSSYGMQCLVDDTVSIYGRATLGTGNTSGKARARFYVDPNSMTMASGDKFDMLFFTNGVPTDVGICQLGYGNASAGSYDIRIRLVNDSATYINSSYYAITDAPHYIELYLVRATNSTSNDGSLAVWVDGTLKTTISGQDNYDKFDQLKNVDLGARYGIDAGTSGTFYLDQLVVNDDGSEIGPVSSGANGALSVTLGLVTISATGTIPASGTATITLNTVTNTSTGTIPTSGSASITLNPVTNTSTGTIPASGSASITLASLTNSARGFVGSAIFADIDHETGDLSEYTTTVIDGGDLSVSAASALGGSSYGLSCLIDDNVVIYGRYDPPIASATGIVRVRFYFDPNSITHPNNFYIFGAYGSDTKMVIGMGYTTSGLQGSYLHDTGTAYVGGTSITDAPHYIEILCKRASSPTSSDGVFQFWIDGNSAYSTTTIDNYDSFTDIDYFRMGFLSSASSVSGTFYMDQLIANQDGSEIGPVPATISGQASITLGSITNSSTATSSISGSLNSTLAVISTTSTGVVEAKAVLSSTLGSISITATATAEDHGSFSNSLSSIAITATGTISISGSLSKTLDNTAILATGTVETIVTLTLTAVQAGSTIRLEWS